eukprot:GHVU01201728.1.p3 GENE.GHVU01201728.1~~GHVU01201728.1.p3  ORF type:complete len:114 (+),score=14.58 GHVU01201728.1:725-1066(+)
MAVLGELCQASPGYSTEVDGAGMKDKEGKKSFALRVRLCANGDVHDFHVANVQAQDVCASDYFVLVSDVMDSLDPQWKTKVVMYTSDGAHVIASLDNGLAGKLLRCCPSLQAI